MKILSEKIYDGKEKLLSYYVNQYNESFQLVSTKFYDSQGILNSYTIFEYNFEGNCVVKRFYNSDNVLQSKVDYDESRRMIKELIFNDGDIEEWTEYQYPNEYTEIIICKDSDGEVENKIVKDLKSGIWEHRNKFDKIDFKEQLEFDLKGRMLKRKNLNINVIPQLIEHRYENIGNMEYWDMYVDRKLIKSEVRVYNTNDQMISLIQKDKKGQVLATSNFDFDKYGNKIFSEYILTGKPIEKRKSIIEYL